MGVPSLYRNLIEKFDDIHTSENSSTSEHLYLDYNCLIHFCKNKFSTKSLSQRDVEEELITEIIQYTSHIICNVVKPEKLVFIAIDGPAPMGKVVKQRARRYKKVQDDAYARKVHEKYEVKREDAFNSNKITPGTQFMFKLSSRLRNFAKLGAFSKHTKKNFKVFISDSNVAGEGEQKIMQFIRKGENKANGTYPNIVIYGLDADLIILSMLLNRTNIKLLREPQNTVVEMNKYVSGDFVYFDITKCCDGLLKEYKLDCYDRESIIKDITFITMFGGNDFVEAFAHCKMKDAGLEKLLNIYSQVLKETGEYVIKDNIPNFKFLKLWLQKLSSIEDHCMKKLQLRFSHSPNAPTEKTPENMINYEMQLYEHTSYKDKNNPFHNFYKNNLYPINYKKENTEWKNEYNKYYFNDLSKEKVCTEFLACLKWTWLYYNEECPSWLWHYEHLNSPLCSDFYEFMSQFDINEIKNLWENINFCEDSPLCPFEQLLVVTPIQHYSILPFCLSMFLKEFGSEYEEIFPKLFRLNVVKGGKNIYSDPILPDINLNAIDMIISECVFSDPEIARNMLNDRLFCHKLEIKIK